MIMSPLIGFFPMEVLYEGEYTNEHQGNRTLKILEKVRNKALDLLKTKYADFGPTLAREKLKERNKIEVFAETVRKCQ